MAGRKDIVDLALKMVMGEGSDAAKAGIRAYHSSPHDFDRFDLSRIGTGEGNQAYGHGLYFAENPKVSGRGGDYWRQFWNKMKSGPEATAANAMWAKKFDREKAAAALESQARYSRDLATPGRYGDGPDVEEGNRLLAEEYERALEMIRSGQIVGPRTYEVEIKARPDQLLDWDADIESQPSEVRKILEKLGQIDAAKYGQGSGVSYYMGDPKSYSGESLYRYLGSQLRNPKASELLRAEGIPGIKYFDGASRHVTPPRVHEAGDGFEVYWGNDPKPVDRFQSREEADRAARQLDTRTNNYVIFDDRLIDIKDKYAHGGSIREGYGPGGWVDDVVKMAGKAVMGGGEKAVGIIPGTFPGKKLPRVDALANNVDKFVYHSGVAEDIPSMKHGVDPQIGPWVKEVLEGSAEDDLVNEIMENAVPVSWWSKRPDWAVMKVARKLGKNPKDVTPEELAQHGHVALIPKKDPEAESMYWVGEQGLSSGPYSEVEDITGRKLKAYETDLYSGDYGPKGVERNEYITPRYVEPYLHLTGNELLDFLRKTGTYNKAHGGRIAKGPGGWLDDVVKMAGKVISGEGEDAAESALRAFAETKLKTPKGKPMRLYHLTPGNFSEFSVSPENRSGPVVFLSPYADFQPAYHQAAERGPNDEITSIFKEGANVMPVYADVRNPLILDSYEKIKEAQTKYQSGDRGFPYFVKPEAKAAMEADGYDGIIFGGNDPVPYRSETSTERWNPHIGFQRNREEEIIVFDPKKVKSAISNTGKYDFTDPDITKAGGGSTSKPQRSMGGNNSISGALNVARGMNGGK